MGMFDNPIPRDPVRIEKVLAVIKRIWERYPDVRLGQLMVNVIAPSEPSPEVYYIEDDKLMEKLLKYEDLLNNA